MGDENVHRLEVNATAKMGHIVAIRPPPLVENATFNITSTMLHLMGIKGFFNGLTLEDPNKYIKIFIWVCLKIL